MKKKRVRVYIGPIETAGYYSNLACGFRSLGVDCDFFTFNSHPYNYGGETPKPKILRLADWFNRFRGKPKNSLFIRFIFAIPGEILNHIWAAYAIFKYDIFVFGFGASLFRGNRDLIFLRWLNKTVISNLSHGSDARPAYINGFLQSKEGINPSVKEIYRVVMYLKEQQDRHEKYATIIIGSPFSTTHFACSRLINAFALGLPINLTHKQNESLSSDQFGSRISQKSVRILHSPSHPAGKGTELIKVAINKLKVRGYGLDFILIHGKPFAEVIEEIQKCDFVVDQIYSDTPMAGFATEAAWFAKPAVVGGYGLETLRQFVPEGMWPPSKTCHPDNIEKAIEDLIVNKEEREKLGREAQVFVREKWNAKEVARRYLRMIQGDFPDEWWLNPSDVVYFEGGGQSIESTKANIRELVKLYGVKSLQLSHRPDFEKAFLEFAEFNGSQS